MIDCTLSARCDSLGKTVALMKKLCDQKSKRGMRRVKRFNRLWEKGTGFPTEPECDAIVNRFVGGNESCLVELLSEDRFAIASKPLDTLCWLAWRRKRLIHYFAPQG